VAAIPQDLLDRIRELERRLRAVEGRAHIRPAMNTVLHGDVVVGEGGQFFVNQADGITRFEVGDLRDDDETGIRLLRRDGTVALSLYNGSGNPTEPQVLRIRDAYGREIVSDDVKAGGLARPYLPYPDLADDDISRWPSTTSTSWTVLQQGNGIAQHPRVRALISRDGGAGGEIRLLIDDVVVATSTGIINTTVNVPSYTYGSTLNFKVEARLTGTATKIWARTRYLYGVPSA
jgi:hypothetical protein